MSGYLPDISPHQRKPLARKILLADDSVTAQNMGRKILADAGYEVITVNNGSAALKRIGEQRPDVIVLDVYMPGYSGLEVCQRLKEVADTARIPILLTVGKLEPFKPEEARRVRADGYIVKPFEASELLSALTKLEDKIIPNSESPKAGRFGRIAAAEASRFDKTMTVEEDAGWKNRISFPARKKQKELEQEEVAPNQAKHVGPAIEPMPVAAPAPQKTEEIVDLGALASGSLPKDVTPEEIAALAAAAARMKGNLAEAKREEVVSEMPVVAPPEPVKEEIAAPIDELASVAAATQAMSDSSKDAEASVPAVSSQPAYQAPAQNQQAQEQIPASVPLQEIVESISEPVTMASAPAVGELGSRPCRWTAVSVALTPEETGLSLEQEMQKAYAAFEAAESGHGASVTSESMISSADTPGSASVPATIAPEAVQDLTAVAAAATDAVTAAVKELEQVASAYAAQVPAPVQPSASEMSPLALESQQEPISLAAAVPVESHNVSAPDQVEVKQETLPEALAAPSPETGQPVTTSESSSKEAPKDSLPQSSTEPIAEQASAASPLDSSAPQQDRAAMAATVGGQPVEEPSSDADPAIASIVDSVLANLRPKIVEEISRKLGKK